MARIILDGGVKVRTFTAPPRGFDAITASPADLLKHGFPARPDHPQQLERYKRVFGGVMKDSFRYIEPKFRVNPNRRHGPPASRHFVGPVRVSPHISHWGSGERGSRLGSVVSMTRVQECHEAVSLGRAWSPARPQRRQWIC